MNAKQTTVDAVWHHLFSVLTQKWDTHLAYKIDFSIENDRIFRVHQNAAHVRLDTLVMEEFV